jgi:hypothetical protein
VERAVRLVEVNVERFAKRIQPRRPAPGSVVLAPAEPDPVSRAERVLAALPADGGSRAILARTNRALLPAAAVALERRVPFRGDGVTLLLEDRRVDLLLARAAASTPPGWPLLVRLGALVAAPARPNGPPAPAIAGVGGPPAVDDGAVVGGHARAAAGPVRAPARDADADAEGDEGDAATEADILAALLAWAARFASLDDLGAAIVAARAALAELRRADASLTLATAHATKGLEFDHVAVIDMDAGRFPSARALADSTEPGRAMEEERRLAYVAWTRARRSLFLVHDPAAPSPFLAEAFDPDEIDAGPRG